MPYAFLDPTQTHALDYRCPRRQVWGHAFEKDIFTPMELENMSAVERRAIYVASIEAYVEALLQYLQNIAGSPVTIEELAIYSGLRDVTAKSILAGLQDDIVRVEHELMVLNREICRLEQVLGIAPELA
ncbi:hypothetical protein C8Q76DRAFT_803389 [Earliella scabrosa]|nr:hypothetical protein C8Q76DRAFT_803389 [Earliella scabrosa]